jgi:two-component system, sensor histidine kinase and response regulator
VLVNFLGNAVKFAERGDIVLEVARAGTGRHLRGIGAAMELAGGEDDRPDGDTVDLAFSVTDEGIGISPEQQARLFKPFVQGDGSTTRRYGGTGLGLVIAQKLARMMGGEVGLASEPDQGSRFWMTVTLPVCTPAAADPLPDLKTLVVSDHRLLRSIALQLLAGGGMIRAWAAPVDGALEELRCARAESQDYELVLLDLDTDSPAANNLASTVRRDPDFVGLRLVAMVPARPAKGDDSGTAPCASVAKPLSVRELSRVLSTMNSDQWAAQAPVTHQ